MRSKPTCNYLIMELTNVLVYDMFGTYFVEYAMTLEFIQSQITYYRKHLNCGHPRDWNQILGLLHYYQNLERKFDE